MIVIFFECQLNTVVLEDFRSLNLFILAEVVEKIFVLELYGRNKLNQLSLKCQLQLFLN